MLNEVLYKFRSLDNWKFVLDIFANNRLHAAPFDRLNDPMDGRYYHFGRAVTEGFKKAVSKSKARRNICSLSRRNDSTLLWAYYAGGHTGIAIGVKVLEARGRQDIEVRPVRYDNGIYIGREELRQDPDRVALNILTQKQLPWGHEEEVRVFSSGNFVAVKLTQVILGCKISPDDEALLRAVIRKWHPRIEISKMRESALDHPEALGR